MRLAILSAVIVSSLMAVTGCSVSGQAAKSASTPTSKVADTANDPSWTPPGQMDMAIGEARVSRGSESASVTGLPQPNKREVLRGQIHAAAATY